MENVGGGSSSSDMDSEKAFLKTTPKRKKKTLKRRVPTGPENEIFWWPKDSVENNVDKTEGYQLSSSLSTPYCSTCESDPIECDYKKYSSSWSAEEVSRVPEVYESESELVTPITAPKNDNHKAINVNKSSWEDLRISSPEYEEEDYLLQLNYGHFARADSLNDLISANVIDKIIPEGGEYQIVFISSSSSTKSSDFNDLALEEFSADSDCEVDKLNFISDFGCDDETPILLSKHNQSQFDDDPPPLPSVPPPFPQLINESFKFYKSPSPTDFFMLENYGKRSVEVDGLGNVTEWKSADILVTDDDDASVNDSSSVYSFVRSDSIRSSGERSISEQCFSNQVFSSVENHLLVINISENCDLNDLLGMSEMNEQKMTFVDDDEEENFQLSVSFDSGTSISDGEIIGGGHVEEGLDSSDEECVAWSYDIASQSLDQDKSENGDCDDNAELLKEEMALENAESMPCDLKDELVTVFEIPSVVQLINEGETSTVTELTSEVETLLVADSVEEIETLLVADSTEEIENLTVAKAIDDVAPPLVAEPMNEIETLSVAEALSEIEPLSDVEAINDIETPSGVESTNEMCISTFEESIDEPEQSIDYVQSPRDAAPYKIEEVEAINDEILVEAKNNEVKVFDEGVNGWSEIKSEVIDELNTGASIENCDEMVQLANVFESQSDLQVRLDNSSACDEAVAVTESELSIVISGQVDESIHEEINSELDKSDTDSQDTVIEGETYRRMRQVAIREKLVSANREWDDEKSDNTPSESPIPVDHSEVNQVTVVTLEENVDASPPVVNLHELIAKSRAMSAAYKQNCEVDDSVDNLSRERNSSSVFEKYFTTSLGHMAPLELDRNRFRQPPLIKPGGEEDEKDDDMDGEVANSDVSSIKSSEDTSEAYDSDRRFEDSSTEGDETFDDDDDNDTSSTISTSSDEGSMFLRPMRPSQFSSSEEAMLMCRQTLDMSLHTIMEESCEESESEERRKPLNLRKSDPSELQRYFEFSFAGTGMPENYFLEKQAASQSNLSNIASNNNSGPAAYQPFMPGDRMSRTDSELSYDTMSETDGSIYSENENRDELMDDEELARLASSRLEKYFLTGMLGMTVGNFLTNDHQSSQNILPASNKDSAPSTSANKESESIKLEINKNKTENQTENQTDSSNEEDESTLGAFEQSEGCNTIKRIKPKVEKEITTLEESVNNSIISYLKGVSVEADCESKNGQFAAKNETFVVKDEVKDDTNVPLTLPWSPAMGGVARSLVALDWKQQSRDSGFIGSSDDLLQEENVDNSVNKTLTITEEIIQNDSISETAMAETSAINENLIIEDSSNSIELEVPIDETKMDQFPVMTSSSVSTTNFGLFRSSSRSTKSGRSVNLYTSDDEAQYIVNQLVNHITKSMSRSPQLSRAKPPAIEAFESELTKLMQTVPAIEFTVKEIVEELSSTDHYSDSYESSDYTSSDQESPISGIGGSLLPFQLPTIPNKTNFGVNLERNDSGRSWRSFGSTGSKNSSIQDGSDEVMSEETIFIYEKFMNSLTKMAEHMSEDANSGIGVMMEEKTRIGSNYSGKNSAPSSGKGSPPTAVRIVQHIRSKLTTLMREVQIERSPSNGSSRSSFRAHIRPTITWNKPSSGCGSVAGDEISISSTTSSVNFDSEDSPTDTELSMDSDDISIPNSKYDLVTLTNYTKDNVNLSLNNSAFSKSGSTNSVLQPQPNSNYTKNTRKGDHLTSTGRPLSLMEKTTTDDDDESEDGLERWSSDMTIVDDDVRFTSVHKSEPMLLSQSGTSDAAISKRLAASQLYSLSSHPDPTSQAPLSRSSMGSLLGAGSSGSSTSSIAGTGQGKNSCKSDWDMWKSISKGGQTSNQKNMPTKYKSCDPLPSAKFTNKSTNVTSTTPRDKKKHAFAFMMKQKSGSSASLRDTSSNQESISIKQQIQFRSSLHLSNVKSKEEIPQTQSQQHRSSSMQWLFGRNKDSSKKGNLPASVGGGVGWSSNPDGISRVGVDVTNAVGIELSDSESSSCESKSRRRGSLNVATSNYNVSPNCVSSSHTISQFSSSSIGNINSTSTGKASTLPRTFTTTTSNSAANHEPRISQEQRHFSTRSSLASKHKSKSVTNVGAGSIEHSSGKGLSPITGHFKITRNVSGSLSSFSKKSKVHSTESPASRRNFNSLSDDLGKRPIAVSNHRRNFNIGDHKNMINISDDSSDIGTRIGNHAGNSDLDNYPEEDIDRLVSRHNRSLSSLGVCSESMSSVYSAAGGGHYGHVAVRGEIQFGLGYNYMTGALEVHIKQCRDLAAVDNKRNRSDPYVKVYLLPDKTKSGKRKTRVKKHTLNPIFNEVLKFCVTISDLETRTLWVTVWHSDMFGRNEFLGEVTIPMGYEAWEDTSLKWYSLQEKLGSPEEIYSYKGDLVISLKYETADPKSSKKPRNSKGSLHVVVKEARNLMAVASNGTSDPFCKSYLLPDKGKGNKKKTNVVKRSCNPKWNHTFVYEDLSLEEVGERCLELTIWDYDRLTSNDFLGGIRLSIGADKHKGKRVDWMDSRGEEVTLWQSMLEKPNTWVEGSVLLRPTMDHRQITW